VTVDPLLIKLAVLMLFLLGTTYIHFRGTARHSFKRQLTDHSTVMAPYNIFDFRVSRHRDGPDEFLRNSRCKVQGDCFSGNRSVVLHSDGRLEFVACWGHARRKVVEASTYRSECDLLLAEWVEADGACPKCIEYYRGISGAEKVKSRPYVPTEVGVSNSL